MMKIKLNTQVIKDKSIHLVGMLLFIILWLLLLSDVTQALFSLYQNKLPREIISTITSLTTGIWFGLALCSVVANKQQKWTIYIIFFMAFFLSPILKGLDNVLLSPDSAVDLDVKDWFFFAYQPYLSFGLAYLILPIGLIIGWKHKKTLALKLVVCLIFINLSMMAIEKTIMTGAYNAITQELNSRLENNYDKTCQGYETYCASTWQGKWIINKYQQELLDNIKNPQMWVHTKEGDFLMMSYKKGFVFSKGALDAELEYQRLTKELFLGIVSIFLMLMLKIQPKIWNKNESQD